MKGFRKSRSALLISVLLWFNVGGSQRFLWAQQASPVAQNANSTSAAQPGPAPPPSSPPRRSTSDLEKLVAPIALYPDPVIAVLLPASAYPLEIVQAARFVRDTNNVAKLDSQTWDSNVKAVARIPEVIKQMDDNIAWTSDLGDAFINQPKELMDCIQSMRTRAESSGALKTTPEQTVKVSETIVTNVVESHTVYVTNQVTEIQPAQPNVVYVPQYNPTVVYAGYPVAYPAYTYPVYSPGAMAATSLLSFGAGMAMGAWLANDCDWGGGGCYHSDVNINNNVNRNVNRDVNRNTDRNRTANANRQKWSPDQNRLKNSGSSLSSAQSRESRGWSSARQPGAGAGSARAGTTSGFGSSRAGTSSGLGSARAGSSSVGSTRPGGGTASQRAQAQPRSSTAQSRPNAGARQAPTGRTGSSQSYNRPSSSSPRAFNSSGGASQARQSSARGASSRSYGGGGARGGGGGGRGGGGRR